MLIEERDAQRLNRRDDLKKKLVITSERPQKVFPRNLLCCPIRQSLTQHDARACCSFLKQMPSYEKYTRCIDLN